MFRLHKVTREAKKKKREINPQKILLIALSTKPARTG